MPKRQVSNNPSQSSTSPDTDVKPDLTSSAPPGSSQSDTAPPTPKSKAKRNDKKPKKEEGSPGKTRWTPEEDQTLMNLLDEVMRGHLWAAVKAEGSLVHRTSYGVQYHAKMLLKQGIKK